MNARSVKSAARARLAAAAVLVLAACSKARPPAEKSSSVAATGLAVRTTSGDLAVRNLEDRLRTLAPRASGPHADLPTRIRLFELLHARAQFLGRLDDLARLELIASAALRDFPTDGRAHLLQARAFSAVHRFEEAEAALARAEPLGIDTALALASIRIARGRELPSVLALAERRAAQAPTLEHLTLWANAEAALGQFERADEHYVAALASYEDVLPFPPAYVLFQRGVMWAEMADDPGRALPFYAEAVARLPQYVAANVHLAELEAASGKAERAIERLRRVVANSSDPEPMAYLGELLATRAPADTTAPQLIARARVRYDELLHRHPAAFWDHAAEFYTGPGADGARALALARENLKLRQTPRAHALVIEAAHKSSDRTLLCSLVASARPLAARSRNLRALLDAEAGCHDGR